jgi:hypothetical protein
MIIVRLMGGLGNQMFQYAIGKRLALLRNVPLKADISFLLMEGLSHTKRTYELGIFGLDMSIATDDELWKFKSIQDSRIKSRMQKFSGLLFPYFTINEQYHEYDSSILQSPQNSLLVGFWQTEKYFLPIQKIIREDFYFKNALDGVNLELSEQIKNTQSVSLHIRRGDYISNEETRQFHGSCSLEYYKNALQLMKSKFPEMQLFIFSDDIDWARENLNAEIPVIFVENNSGDNGYIDMQLMSLCKHNIIANSSFSWWGAWLNNNPEKVVIAPEKWFNEAKVNTKDVIPEGWYKL